MLSLMKIECLKYLYQIFLNLSLYKICLQNRNVQYVTAILDYVCII